MSLGSTMHVILGALKSGPTSLQSVSRHQLEHFALRIRNRNRWITISSSRTRASQLEIDNWFIEIAKMDFTLERSFDAGMKCISIVCLLRMYAPVWTTGWGKRFPEKLAFAFTYWQWHFLPKQPNSGRSFICLIDIHIITLSLDSKASWTLHQITNALYQYIRYH